MTKKKVYCKDCKYQYGIIFVHCKEPHEVTLGDYYSDYDGMATNEPEYKNKNNDCKWYEEK